MDRAILTHFHPNERPFVEKLADIIARTDSLHELRRTEFLDPRQASIVESLVHRHSDLQLMLEGGHPDAERKRALIAPDYMTLTAEDAGLCVIAIHSADAKLAELDHGDYLGALLGLGVKRDVIGDLHVHPNGCHCVVAEELATFIDLHLKQVHRVGVSTSVLPIHELVPVIPTREEMSFTVASMRLDAIVGDVWRLSRAKALVPIKAGRCRVNWKTEENPSCLLQEGDTISLKGFGRFVIHRVDGETKKGRIRLTVAKFV